jgi:hypothetical protein
MPEPATRSVTVAVDSGLGQSAGHELLDHLHGIEGSKQALARREFDVLRSGDVLGDVLGLTSPRMSSSCHDQRSGDPEGVPVEALAWWRAADKRRHAVIDATRGQPVYVTADIEPVELRKERLRKPGPPRGIHPERERAGAVMWATHCRSEFGFAEARAVMTQSMSSLPSRVPQRPPPKSRMRPAGTGSSRRHSCATTR